MEDDDDDDDDDEKVIPKTASDGRGQKNSGLDMEWNITFSIQE